MKNIVVTITSDQLHLKKVEALRKEVLASHHPNKLNYKFGT